ncbi:hypothetical protein OS493_021474 [Desmophyllum pertusum]|uniref:Neurotransmitter-gated ion-channel ligand-binding domain-containing protein n=1 Tax=Desmophyllum pertusum TaxID=174260 RepID=A0A9W9YYW2_9CNID|nr:hypothetical protein OS493_021474 [Desmophyllum pertusum]
MTSQLTITYFKFHPDGNIFYSVRLTVTMACKLNLQMFPHDVQTCTVMLESYGYQATDVYYKWNSRNSTGDVVFIAEDLEMPQFMINQCEARGEDKYLQYWYVNGLLWKGA